VSRENGRNEGARRARPGEELGIMTSSVAGTSYWTPVTAGSFRRRIFDSEGGRAAELKRGNAADSGAALLGGGADKGVVRTLAHVAGPGPLARRLGATDQCLRRRPPIGHRELAVDVRAAFGARPRRHAAATEPRIAAVPVLATGQALAERRFVRRAALLTMAAIDGAELAAAAVAVDLLAGFLRRIAVGRRAALVGNAIVTRIARLPERAVIGVRLVRAGEETGAICLALLVRAIDTVVRAVRRHAALAAGRALAVRALAALIRAVAGWSRYALEVLATDARIARIVVRAL